MLKGLTGRGVRLRDVSPMEVIPMAKQGYSSAWPKGTPANVPPRKLGVCVFKYDPTKVNVLVKASPRRG